MDGGGDSTLSHSFQHVHISDAVAALQRFIGVNGSTDVNSLQYKLANGLAQGPVGPTGPAGTSGLQGIQGPVGPTGPAGTVSTGQYALGSIISTTIPGAPTYISDISDSLGTTVGSLPKMYDIVNIGIAGSWQYLGQTTQYYGQWKIHTETTSYNVLGLAGSNGLFQRVA
jgi:hypothetical protein